MPENNIKIEGLTNEQVIVSREKFGRNELQFKKEYPVLNAVKGLAKEPMLILLLTASVIYFIGGNIGDAIFMLFAIVLVSGISLYQEARSRNALEQLKKFTKAKCKVIRNGLVVDINTSELVLGDSLLVEEGELVAADGAIVRSNDFSLDESILTGESFAVAKDKTQSDNYIFQGTTVVSGSAIATITSIGNNTRLGKIGKSLQNIHKEKTPLEQQINNFVKIMVMVGAVIFLLVWIVNYVHSKSMLDSLLKALTLAMSILPEEIPVAFTTFMALGAWRLMKLGIVVKQMKTVETLGGATVICTDKTGTLTENKMSLAKLFVPDAQKAVTPDDRLNEKEKSLLAAAMWASETIPFDPMEIALHQAYGLITEEDERPYFKMIHEYPLSGKPPMMTHIFENSLGERVIAAKGAPEALLAVASMTEPELEKVQQVIDSITGEGYRVLGVGTTLFKGNDFPHTQQEFKFDFLGVVAFYDPPKANIPEVLQKFYQAGISVKIITGDNAATTTSIARQIRFRGYEKHLSGEELMSMEERELQQAVATTNIFTRMFPDAKFKIINALKANREIVAMTGDGVNDGPALKAAHIGIAMGKKGTEIAKRAASLVLIDDDLSKMVDAVAMGRKIYTNLKKAIQYIISIHIPIILTVFIPLMLGWVYPNIFSPVHIILLELIMGPTCSIVYENEPMEPDAMTKKPRPFSSTFFRRRELSTSVLQGLVITAGTLICYQYAVNAMFSEAAVRTMTFTTLITANIFLTLVNRSFFYSLFTTLRYKNNMVLIIMGATVFILFLILYVNPLTAFFSFERLNIHQLLLSISIGTISVIWYEVVKWAKRKRIRKVSR